jgi:hypothetical protein
VGGQGIHIQKGRVRGVDGLCRINRASRVA